MLRIDAHYLTPAVTLRTDMDQLISDVFGTPKSAAPTVGGRRGHPAVDIWEENEDYFVAIDVPGLSESEVKITALGRELTLETSGTEIEIEKACDSKEKASSAEATYFHRESNTLSFHRVIRLPFEIDAPHVEGSLQAGVLTIRVPKAASAKPRQIEIQTS